MNDLVEAAERKKEVHGGQDITAASVLKWLKGAWVDIGRKMTGKGGISFWEQTILHVRINSSKELQVHSPGFHCSLETSLLFLWGNILLLKKNSFTELPK